MGQRGGHPPEERLSGIECTMTLLIVAAVEPELDRLKAELNARTAGTVGGYAHYECSTGTAPVFLGITGVGVVSAALALAGFIATVEPDRIIMIGSAGALPGSDLSMGDVVIASDEILSEMGLCTGPGVGDSRVLGFAGEEQEISLSRELSGSLLLAAQESTSAILGRFLTVVGVSAHESQARARARTFEALAENMEGYALALAGARFGIEVGEIRAISNSAGVRDKSAWDLETANERAQSAVLDYMKGTL